MMQKTVMMAVHNDPKIRPTAMLVQIACRYNSEIYIGTGSSKVNAKSIMGMMTLGLDAGKEIEIMADGTDAALAVAELERFLTSNSGGIR